MDAMAEVTVVTQQSAGFDPYNQQHRERLFKAVERSDKQMGTFRSLLRELVRDYAGSSYLGNDDSEPYDTVINLVRQAAKAATMSLAANEPQILITANHPELEAFAQHFKVSTNNLIKEIGLKHVIRRWVLDAFFMMGVVKVYQASSGFVQLEEDVWADPGKPFAENITLDNFGYDLSAKEWSQIQYAYDTYRVDHEEIKQRIDIFDPEVVEAINPTSKYRRDDETLKTISTGETTDEDELMPKVDLIDVWVPSTNMIYTWACTRHSSKLSITNTAPLSVMEWDGPEFGPYHLLKFDEVPENIMAISAAADVTPLHRQVNSLLRKQYNQANRQKTFTTYTPAGAKDASRMKSVPDGGSMQVRDNSQVQERAMGGVDAGNAAFTVGQIELFDRMTGAKRRLGLGASTDTVGQERIVDAHGNAYDAQMTTQTLDATTSLIRDLGYMAWHDKMLTMNTVIDVEGTGITIPSHWTPEDREGDFFDYNFSIDPFSMAYKPPQQRAQTITTVLREVFAPFIPAIMQGAIDGAELVDLYAELLSEPRLRKLFPFAGSPMDGGPSPQGMATMDMPMPSNTTRTYERTTVPSGQPPGGMQQALMQLANQQAAGRMAG